jgi:hypothetical protein
MSGCDGELGDPSLAVDLDRHCTRRVYDESRSTARSGRGGPDPAEELLEREAAAVTAAKCRHPPEVADAGMEAAARFLSFDDGR